MALVELAVVLGVSAVLAYLVVLVLGRTSSGRRPAVLAGRWRTAHHDADGSTLVVLQKVSPDGRDVLDEHLVASIPVGDPEYDERFLAAMAAARQRLALFEQED